VLTLFKGVATLYLTEDCRAALLRFAFDVDLFEELLFDDGKDDLLEERPD
jgi:hypothetical protein